MVQLIRLDNGQVFMTADHKVTNNDGSVSFVLPNNSYGGQEPNQYGVRNDSTEPKMYQRATQNGSTVTFQTRDGDIPFMYIIVEGKAYPS